MKFWKRILSVATVAAMLCGANAACAEETVNAILFSGTTQAFTEEAVADADLNAIVEAGLSATSAMNAQPWFFAVVTNKELMAEISGRMSFGGAMPSGANMPEGAAPPEGTKPSGGDAAGEPGTPAPTTSAKAALGSSPVAIIVYMDESGVAGAASFDCGLACQNMFLAANALGYGAKIVSSPTMALNGDSHDALCEKLGVDKALKAVAVLLIGKPDRAVDGSSGATTRSRIDEKVSFVK